VWKRVPQKKKLEKHCIIGIKGIGKKWNNSVQQSFLFEKLTVPQLVKNVSKLYGIRKFITVFTTAQYIFLS
jgi:hypothetical protein